MTTPILITASGNRISVHREGAPKDHVSFVWAAKMAGLVKDGEAVEVVEVGPGRAEVEGLLLTWEDDATWLSAQCEDPQWRRLRDCIDELRALMPVSAPDVVVPLPETEP